MNVIRQAQESGKPKWAELFYKRFEGWSEKQTIDANVTPQEPLTIEKDDNAED
jgi:hypothetical protein